MVTHKNRSILTLKVGLQVAWITTWGLVSGCSNGVNGGLNSATLTVNSIGTSEKDTNVTFTAPSGTGYTSVIFDQGRDFSFQNICRGTTIFGRKGYANCGASNLARTVGTTQLSSAAETKTYAGSGSSPTLPSTMREVPDVTLDDEAYNTLDISGGCAGAGCSPALPISLSTHMNYTDCGTTQTTALLRIADCASKNGNNSTWNGATYGIRGEGTWKLVARNGSRKEVWQDQRTGLLWTSLANDAANYSYSWCQASGNTQSNYHNCSAGGGDQPATPISFCKEMSGFAAGSGFADTPLTGPYAAQKGGMGLASTPSIRWRLPTAHDYFQAEIDGIRMVMPDMGALVQGSTYEWSSTIDSNSRDSAWLYSTDNIQTIHDPRSHSWGVRCVGR